MASLILRAAGARLARWLDRDEPVVGQQASSAIAYLDPVRAAAVARAGDSDRDTWAEIAGAHVDHWRLRVLAVDGPLGARDVRRMRTALRRLRAIVRLVASDDESAAIDRALRRLGKRLGELRDADVALAGIAARHAACGSDLERAALDELEVRIVRQRERVLPTAARRLDAAAVATAMTELRGLLSPALAVAEPIGLATRWWAQERVEWLGAVRGQAPWDEGDLEPLHAIRIAARRVRYGVELFGAAAPADAREWLADVVALQRALGAHRDAALFHERVTARVERATRRGHVALARGLGASVIAARAERLAAFGPARTALVAARTRADTVAAREASAR